MALSGNSGGGDVKIGVQVDGIGDATRAITALQQTISGLNQTAGGSAASAPANTTGGYAPTLSFAPAAPGVLNGGATATMPASMLAPGALAPPAPGVAPTFGNITAGARSPYATPMMGMPAYGGVPGASGTTTGGTTIITAGTVVLQAGHVQGGGGSGGNGGYGGSGGSVPPGGGAPPAPGVPNGGTNSPVPGWNPFGGGGGSGQSFAEQVYGHLDNLTPINVPGLGPANLRGKAGADFLSQNGLGRQVFSGLQGLEPFLPAGALDGAAAMLGAAAAPLAVVGAVGEVIGTGMQVYTGINRAGYYQKTREIATSQSGRFYDPLAKESDERVAEIERGRGGWDAFRGSLGGQILRTASFGIADGIYANWTQQWDREKAVEEARKDRRMSARDLKYLTGDDVTADAAKKYDWNGANVPESLKLVGEKATLARASGAFAPGQGATIANFDFSKYSSAAAGIATMERLYGFGMTPGFEKAGFNMLAGGDPRQNFGTYRQDAIARGDMSGLFAVREEYNQQLGGIESGMVALRKDLSKALGIAQARTQGQIASSNLGAGQAGIGMMEASGAGYAEIAQAEQKLGGSFDGILGSLRKQRDAAVNPLDKARLDEQIAQARTQQFTATKRAPALRVYQGEQTVNEGDAVRAGNAITRATYGDGNIGNAYGERLAATRDRERILRNMARSPFFSPEQKALYAAQADGLANQSKYDIPREEGGYLLGITQGEIGVRGAKLGAAASQANLYGGVGDIYKASVAQADILRQQLRVTGAELGGGYGPRTEQEKLELQQRQIDLQRQLNESLEGAKRSFASASLGVAQFTQSIGQSQSGYQMQYFGVGGGAAGNLQTTNVANARGTLAVAQKNFDAVKGLPADNEYRMQRERELQSAKEGAQDATQAYARLPYSVDLERGQAAAQFKLGAITRTYAAFGDIRGTVKGLMGNVGERGKELRANERQGLAAIDADPNLSPGEKDERKKVLKRDIEQRKYALGNEAIGYQQELEQGWQDRLISSVVGMPERGAFVASQFTRREAAPFVQSMSSVFGFAGAGGKDSRDYFLHRGGRIANSVVGVIQRPDGFNETAMAMANGGVFPGRGMGEVTSSGKLDGTLKVDVTVRDPRGNELGRGNTSQSVHDIFTTKDIQGSRHTAGVSRQ